MKTWQNLHRRLHKLAFYVRHAPAAKLPHAWFRQSPDAALKAFRLLPEHEQQIITRRVEYYNQLNQSFSIPIEHQELAGTFQRNGRNSSYFYDLKTLLRHFPATQAFEFLSGDIDYVPPRPVFVKSRPISDNNANAVLLKLDSVRHFYVVNDPYAFADKQDKLVWRGAAHQPHRTYFLEQFHHHPFCDVGCVHEKSRHTPYHRDYLSVHDQLRYRYILSIEGNDVATNLKWIMHSQSVCVMRTPRFETWLMEGLLQADVHYIHLEDDYANLDEKLTFYRNRPAATQKIIANANQWMQPFLNRQLETITQLLVMQKYFHLLKH